MIGIDIFIPRKSLAAMSGAFLGLVVGMVLAFGLGLIVDLLVVVWEPSLAAQVESDGAARPALLPVIITSGSGDENTARQVENAVDAVRKITSGSGDENTARQVANAVDAVLKKGRARSATDVNGASAVIHAVKLMLGIICCYFAISFILQTKDDIRFVVPYVEFARQSRGSRPMILDTSVIIDGRIADICETRILDSPLIIPRFVLQELQAIADSSDKLKRNRGRRGLDMLNKLQTNDKVDIRISDARLPSSEEGADVDEKLVALGKKIDGRVVTNDYNLNKIAQLRGVDVININDLANALKPVVLPGEGMMVKIIKPGEEMGQGIGYLEDGTMIVAENTRDKIGEEVSIVVTSVLQTSAGRMIFGRPEGTPATPRRYRPRT